LQHFRSYVSALLEEIFKIPHCTFEIVFACIQKIQNFTSSKLLGILIAHPSFHINEFLALPNNVFKIRDLKMLEKIVALNFSL
jgi:hypothetical protein